MTQPIDHAAIVGKQLRQAEEAAASLFLARNEVASIRHGPYPPNVLALQVVQEKIAWLKEEIAALERWIDA